MTDRTKLEEAVLDHIKYFMLEQLHEWDVWDGYDFKEDLDVLPEQEEDFIEMVRGITDRVTVFLEDD